MRKLTRYLLWAFVFTVPWDNFPLPVVGSISRLFGLALVGAAVLTTIIDGRFRKPDAILGCTIAFSLWGALSLLWTMSYGNTVVLTITYMQFAASVWVIRELVRTREQMEPLLAAICFGLFVPLADLLNNFRLDRRISKFSNRFSGNGLNADQVGVYLVLGLPIAWHVLMHRRGIVRVVAVTYVVAAPVGLLLTGTRGAFIAGIVALTIVPLSLPRQSLRSYALAAVMLTLGTVAAVQFVPQDNWKRIMGITSEIEGGSMSGRRQIWDAGLQAFPQRPLLGAGLGAYGEAVGRRMAAHNLALGLLVEEGILGLCLFAGILLACARTIVRSPPPHRATWSVLGLTWVVAGLAGSPENAKLTWVLIGLIAAQSGLTKTGPHVSPIEPVRRTASDSLRPATV
jgi:O-antigen ligase